MLPAYSVCKQLVMGRVLDMIKVGIDRSPVGPVRVIMESSIEYDLVGPIKSAILNANYIPLGIWKIIVLERIHAVERSTFHAKSLMYSKLNLFVQCISLDSIWPWWVHLQYCPGDTRYCRTVLRLLTGEHELNSNGRHASRICQNCDVYVTMYKERLTYSSYL